MIFYNRYGIPIAYEEQGIYLFSGQPVAFITDEAVYSYSGRQLGWYDNGWVRDLSGKCVFYTEGAYGFGPLKPCKQIAPIKFTKLGKPACLIKQARCGKVINSMAWSSLSGRVFFEQ